MNGRLNVKLLWILMLLILAACQPAAPLPSTPAVTDTPTIPAVPAVEDSPTHPPASPTPPEATKSAEPAPQGVVLEPDGSLLLTPVSQYGGSITAFAVEDDLLFAAHGPRLLVYDITDPSAPRPLGEPFPLNWLAVDMAIQDRFLYMIDRQERLFIFHAPDPESMYVNGAYEGAGSSRIFIQGEWGFTSSDDCVQGVCTSTLKLFALSAPATAEPALREGAVGPDLPLTATLDIGGGVLKVFSDGQHAYIAHQNGLVIASLPGLQIVREIKSELAYDAVYRAPFLYLIGWGSQRIFDLTDPSNPLDVTPEDTEISLYPGAPAAFVDRYLFGFNSMGEFGHCISDLKVLDLSVPLEFKTVELDSSANLSLNCASRMLGYNDLLIALDWNGLHLIDASAVDQPKIVSSIDNQPGMVEVMVDGYGYGRSGVGLDELMAVDLNDPYAIQAFGPFPPQWVGAVVHKDGYLFIPAWEDGLHMVDISDPISPKFAAQITSKQLLGPALDADLWGDLLFVARGERGIALFDVSDPARPVKQPGYEPPPNGEEWTRTSRVAAGEGYAASLEELWRDDLMLGGLALFTINSAAEMERVAQWDVEEPFLWADLLAAGHTAYLLTSGCQDNACQHRVDILDVQDPSLPRLLSSLQVPGEARRLMLHEEHLFVSAMDSGVYAWNVADPVQPRLAAQVNTPGTVTGAVVEDDLLILSDGNGGLLIYQMVK